MPITTATITVDPRGRSMVVDVQDTGGTSVTCYTAVSGDTAHELPVTITSATSFYLPTGGRYLVSALVSAREIAGLNGEKASVVVESGGPAVEVVPNLDERELLDVAENVVTAT